MLPALGEFRSSISMSASPAYPFGLRSLVGIPIGGLLLEVVGASNLVAFLGGVLVISFIAFVVARWACLGYHWKWFTLT